MRLINPIQHNYARYFLTIDGDRIPIIEPDNWNTAKKEFLRSKQYHGFTINISELINFSGDTAILLEEHYMENGGSAFVQIIEERKDGITDDWEIYQSGLLDFTSAEFGYEEFSCKINSGELEKTFTSRWRTELNVLNKTDLNGLVLDIQDLETKEISIHDRGLQGINTLDIGTEYTINLEHSASRNFNYNVVLLTKLSETYYNLPQPYEVSSEKFTEEILFTPYPGIDNIFFYQRQEGTVEVEIEIYYEAIVNTGTTPGTFGLKLGEFMVEEYEDGDTDKIRLIDINQETLESVSTLVNTERIVSYSSKYKRTIENGRAFILYQTWNDDLVANTGSSLVVKKCFVNLTGDTTSDATKNKVYMPFDFFERHILLMGGGILESEYLSKCRYSLCTGFMVRNVEETEDQETPVSITFQKLYNSFDTVKPIGMSIDRNTVRIEAREYFYQTFKSYDFGSDVDNVKIVFDKELAYSEVNIGFEVSNFSAEDALDEFNVRTVFTTPINNYRKRYNAVSDIQASSYVIEKLRRVQYNEYLDRTYSRRGDTTLYFIDLEDNEYVIRSYSTDFEGVPENLYKSNDAYNFRFSPVNRLRTQGAWINHGLFFERDSNFIYSSSTGNTDLITKPIGKIALSEKGPIQIKETGRPRFVNEYATFIIKPINLTKILYEKINGVQKMYGIFSFVYRGRKLMGYLMSYKPETFEVKLQLIQLQ